MRRSREAAFVFLILAVVTQWLDSCVVGEDSPPMVRVYDNVLSAPAADWLHQESLKLSKGNKVTLFPLEEPTRHTVVEQFLDQLLRQLYPNAEFYVEFWKRSEWHHILAHADMDGR